MHVDILEYMTPNKHPNPIFSGVQYTTNVIIAGQKYLISEVHFSYSMGSSTVHTNEAMAFKCNSHGGDLDDLACVTGEPGSGLTNQCLNALLEVLGEKE